MAKYLEVAAEANKTAKQLYELLSSKGCSEDELGEAACLIARLVNYGLRCCPRPPQSTVRLKAVERSVKGLPVFVSMETKESERGTTYNALITVPEKG